MASSIPDQKDFAQPRARRDQRHRRLAPRAGLQGRERRRLESENSVAGRFQIVHELHAPGRDALGERGFVDHPRQVRRRASSIDHGPSDADAGRVDRRRWAVGEKLSDRVGEGGEALARQDPFADGRERAAPYLEERERGLRAADVSREDHPVDCSTWPPNFCRMADSTFSAKV